MSVLRYPNHKTITFKSIHEMAKWIKADSETLELSALIFDAIVYCMENSIDTINVFTLLVNAIDADDSFDVNITKRDFHIPLNRYYQHLLRLERYEELSVVKAVMDMYEFKIST